MDELNRNVQVNKMKKCTNLVNLTPIQPSVQAITVGRSFYRITYIMKFDCFQQNRNALGFIELQVYPVSTCILYFQPNEAIINLIAKLISIQMNWFFSSAYANFCFIVRSILRIPYSFSGYKSKIIYPCTGFGKWDAVKYRGLRQGCCGVF